MAELLFISRQSISKWENGTYVTDIEKNKLNGFLVTPVKRQKLTISYYLATVFVTFVLAVIMYLLAFLYLGISSGVWHSFLTIIHSISVIGLYVCISIPIMIFLVSFIKSNNAFGALSSIVGTLIGFLAGIYIPLAVFDTFTKTVASLLPFSHMTIYLRRLLIGKDLIAKIPQQYLTESGIDYIKLAGIKTNIYIILAIFLALSLVFLTFAYLRMNKKSK